MRTVLLTYATPAFAPYQAINRVTGEQAGFDECRALGPLDLDPAFVRAHEAVLAAPRGAGYWLWKPYVVQRALEDLDDGDLLFYCDAAAHFVAPIRPMVDLLEAESLDLLVLGEGFTEAEYTKRDAFVLMGCDAPRYAETPQRFASWFLLRKGRWAVDFASRYLAHARDPRILTDAANTMGRPNHPGFVDHRHDQSIFSLLTKILEVPVVPTPFVAEGLAARDGQILNHTRTHHSPGRVVQHLVGEGVLRVDDLPRIARPSVP